MSLNLYFTDTETYDKEVITDVEREFAKITLAGSEEERKLIEVIEKGVYNDSNTFIDRFGVRLYIEQLSTGCKAALCVVNRPDFIIDTVECGMNARDAIVLYCKEGNIIFRDPDVTIDGEISNIDVKIGECRFMNLSDLNWYLKNEYPLEPGVFGGIKNV